jgi:hypothetical protein
MELKTLISFQLFKDFPKSLAIAGLFSFLLVAVSNLSHFEFERSKKDLFYAPPDEVEHFHFGYQENIADSLWLRVIQDFDFCEQNIGHKICQNNGWVSKVLYSISKLSPHFRMAMYTGPLMLTVVVNDISGASRLFDRAVELFPNDWPILYAAGYQAMIEEKNKDKAAHLLEAAAKNGAPAWIYGLATRLYTEAGEKELAEHLYEGIAQSNLNPELLSQIRERLQISKVPENK